MNQMIGGMFGLPDRTGQPTPPPFIGPSAIELVNARSGLRFLVDRLEPTQVWLPSYICDTVVSSLGPAVDRVRYFEMTGGLTIATGQWIEEVRSGDVVVMVAYFGFPIDNDLARRVRQRGAILVIDACQALLTCNLGEESDFYLYSPRKFLGVPDGGILVNRRGIELGPIELQPSPTTWWNDAHEAVHQRREFDLHGGSRDWFELSQRVEKEHPVGQYAMSELTTQLLQEAFDYPRIAQRRRENFSFLLHHLDRFAIYRDLTEGVTPLGFPMAVPNRDDIRQALFDKQIYPPIHWPISDSVPDIYIDSRRLASRIMTLPCDQRYRCDDMRRIVSVVKEAVAYQGTICP